MERNKLPRLNETYLMLGLGMVALIPFNHLPHWKFQIFTVSVPFHFLLFSWIGAVQTWLVVKTVWKKKFLPKFFVLGGLIFLSLLLSSMMAISNQGEAFRSSLGFYLRCLAPGFACFYLIREKSFSHKWIVFLVFLAAVVSFGSLFEVLTGWSFLVERHSVGKYHAWFYPPERGIAVGAMGAPLPLSIFLVSLFPFVLWFGFKKKNWISFIPSILLAVAVLLTYRRSGYFLLLSTVLLFLFLFNQKKNALFILLIIIGGWIGIMGISSTFRQTFFSRFNIQGTVQEIKKEHRTMVYGSVAKILKKRPALGIGTRQFTAHYRKFSRYKNAYDTPDNQLLRFLAENGLLGFSFFMWFLIYVFWRGFLIPDKGMKPVILLALCNFSLCLLLLDSLYWPATQMLFGVLSGMAVGLSNSQEGFGWS